MQRRCNVRPTFCTWFVDYRSAVLALLMVAFFTRTLAAQDELAKRLQPIMSGYSGQVAVAIEHLSRPESFYYQADQAMPTASLIKFPIMIEAYRQAAAGQLDLQKMVTLSDDDKVPGSGILTTHFSAGAAFQLRDAIRLMIAYSDNTATNLVIDQIGLPATTACMENLSCPNTQLHSKVFRRDTSIAVERSRQFGLGSTTAREMVSLFRRLAEGKLADQTVTDEMLSHLYACDDRSKIGRGLPVGTKFAHKTGSVAKSRCDAGLIDSPTGKIIICVLTNENSDESWTDENAAHKLCGDIGRVAFEFFNPPTKVAADAQPQVLRVGAEGRLVATLQRTLSARLAPSVEIDIDGDFGPQTEQAVRQFQELHKLPVTGAVDEATWKALGSLVESGPVVPEPELVNATPPVRGPADSLDGPPHVTCKAWGVFDGATGDLLWGHEPSRRVNPASTTKMMTALLTLEWAAQRPDRFSELVTFSSRADKTAGSTADLNAGEQVSVGELLYGLMLPSGNDASVALAEHVGQTLPEPAAGSDPVVEDPLARFVQLMNQRAAELGMQETHYENPHGLTVEGHLTSARDLARLAQFALKNETFQRIVNTVQHGATVRSVDGYERNVLWKNTNRLLSFDGYDGVKTGTTDAAGACLVASGKRDGRHLIVVVLGSTSSDGRYADSRNLFRWAWTADQPGQQQATEDRADPVLVSDLALRLHQDCLVIDGHNDLPWRMRELGATFDEIDIAKSQPKMHTDIPRLRQGGVGAQFWSVYVPVEVGRQGKALLTTLEQIDRVHSLVEHYPDVFQLAGSVAEIREARANGKIASLIGVEGGHSIENSLSVLRQLYQRGARYMTLTHSSNLDWADSATDEANHHGLTPFGEEVVREMNRLGMLVDLSHVSVETMRHALRITKAPVIFSHSSARAVADHPRNVPDEILQLLPQNGGVVMVNFYPSFVVPAAAERSV
ncbi:MAG: membrane dipeptidase, partial [Planctomycetales bacterium]|nr:membrane dipeptidase [Planctomycetales bacterium]